MFTGRKTDELDNLSDAEIRAPGLSGEHAIDRWEGEGGRPAELIDALIAQGARDLTIVNNNAGNGETGLAALLKARRVRKIICSFPRQSDSYVFDGLYRAKDIELELKMKVESQNLFYYNPAGDLIVAVNQVEIGGFDDLKRLVAQHPRQLQLAVVRARNLTFLSMQ